MVQTVGITKAITNLEEAQEKFNLSQKDDRLFFTEWYENLPDLNEREKTELDRLKNRYLYYVRKGKLTEGTIKIILLSPLLELMGLCDPPFEIQGEKYVKIEIEDGGEEEPVLEGYIDALVVQDKLWIVLIESKRYGFSVMQALGQTLAYMMANPNSENPFFGMITNGEDYVFVKLDKRSRQYALSDKFTLIKQSSNELYEVVKVIKRFIMMLSV